MAYTKIGFTNGTTKLNADNMKHIEDGIYDNSVNIDTNTANIANGWINPNETWTYVSVDDPTGVITISGDKTGKYSLGMRINFTNGGNVIYGIITKISYSSPNTTLTFLHEINTSTGNSALHLMANSAITANYYSSMKAPFGFPAVKSKWTVEYLVTSGNALQANPTLGTWYYLGSYNTGIPISSWDIFYSIPVYAARSVAGECGVTLTLSTTTNSETISKATTGGNSYSVTSYGYQKLINNFPLDLTVKTNLKVLVRVDTSGITDLRVAPSLGNLLIRATCAYL